MNYNETRKEIDRLLKSINTVAVFWGIDDVISVSDKKLTDQECMEVLNLVIKNHDCNFGITWDHITDTIKTLGLDDD